MIRAECRAGTDLGKAACSIVSKGGLISDEMVNGVVASRTARPDCANGYLLDGYPRTVPQAIWFSALLRERGLPDPVVLHLDVADEALVTRLNSRRQCPVCKEIYNLISLQPRVHGFCDHCMTPLITRDDDRDDVIRQRLRAYEQLTGPILKWYGPRFVRSIDGSMPASQVRSEIERIAMEAACVYA